MAARVDAVRAAATPLVALLRRDLLAGQRGPTALWARGMAALAAGGMLLGQLWGTAQQGRLSPTSGSEAASLIFLLLLVAGFLLAPAVAVSSLRREREAGMLDLLLLAGVRPGVLAAGRILSTFLLLESLLFAALPALSLFWFYRRPSWTELGLATTALSCHFLALAAVFVAISAWSRQAGYAIALSFAVLTAWVVVFIGGTTSGLPTTPLLLAERAYGGGSQLPLASHVQGDLLNLAVALAGGLLAHAGLKRAPARVTRDRLLEKVQRRRLPLTNDWPLTWLLQRGSAPARPRVQAVLVLLGCAMAAFVPSEATAVLGACLVLAGFVVAMGLGASSIAPQRERKTWPSLLSTALPASRMMLDMLRGVLLGSVLLVLAGFAISAWSLRAATGVHAGHLALAAASVLATWALAATAGLAGSLVARSAAGAMTYGAAFLLLEPCIALAGSSAYRRIANTLGDANGAISWLMLVAAASFGGAWLVLRGGWRRPHLIVAAMLPMAGTCVLPLVIDPDAGHFGAGPLIAAGAFGLAALIHGLRRERGGAVLVGTFLIAACLVVPIVGAAIDANGRVAAVFGGTAWPFVTLSAVVDGAAPAWATLVLGTLHHGLLALTLAFLFLPRLERWLGRSA